VFRPHRRAHCQRPLRKKAIFGILRTGLFFVKRECAMLESECTRTRTPAAKPHRRIGPVRLGNPSLSRKEIKLLEPRETCAEIGPVYESAVTSKSERRAQSVAGCRRFGQLFRAGGYSIPV